MNVVHVTRPVVLDRRAVERIASLLDEEMWPDGLQATMEFVEAVMDFLDRNIEMGRGGGATYDAKDAFMQLLLQLEDTYG